LLESSNQYRFNGVNERALWQSFSKFWPVVANRNVIRRMTDSFADSGRPSDKQTLTNRGF
jgi:hypothetical protein